jgi:ferritin-like metal-binding protein YciE
MMEISRFEDMYIAELQELASLEGQLEEALLQMANMASHGSLKNALIHYHEQTLLQRQRLESILRKHGANPHAHTDQAMQALISEAKKMSALVKGDDLRDAAIIASMQKVKHYEIAAYGTAASLAGQLDLRDDQQTLYQIMGEKKAADAVLTKLAKDEVNQDALAV